MASEVGIANAALIKLGADRITSLEDNVDRARVLNARYADVRDAELRRHRWLFSLARHSLPADATVPMFGYDYQYTLPADCLRVIQVNDYDLGPNLSDYRAAPMQLWSIEGRKIYTSLPPPLKVRTIQRITDTGLYDPCFVEALAARLAYECCERITQSDSKRQLALADYRLAIREAIQANALEVAPGDTTDDSWISVRSW
jgi:hypothetical protein